MKMREVESKVTCFDPLPNPYDSHILPHDNSYPISILFAGS